MSGHSKWSQIKYKKAIEDAKRAKIFSKISRLITLAAREKGGDPEKNSDLKSAIEKAKAFNMPQDSIERAIKRGTGEIEGGKLESFLIEALGPGNVSILIQVVTDNKNRSLAEIRKIIEDNGGKMVSGSVIWKFKKMGKIVGRLKNRERREEVELLAIESGAEDIREKGENTIEIYTLPENANQLKEKLANVLNVEEMAIEFVPKEEISLSKEILDKVNNLFEKLDDHDDVQEIYSDLKEENFNE